MLLRSRWWRGLGWPEAGGILEPLALCPCALSVGPVPPQTNQEGTYGVRTFHLTNGEAVVTPSDPGEAEAPSLEQGAGERAEQH